MCLDDLDEIFDNSHEKVNRLPPARGARNLMDLEYREDSFTSDGEIVRWLSGSFKSWSRGSLVPQCWLGGIREQSS